MAFRYYRNMKKKYRNSVVLLVILLLALAVNYLLTNKNRNWNKIQKSLFNEDRTAHSNSTRVTEKTYAKQDVVKVNSITNMSKALRPSEMKDKTCGNLLALAYVKVHKTGSTTIQKILRKHKMTHDPQNTIVIYPAPRFGYPMSFQRNLAVVESKPTKGQLWKPGQRPDVIFNHWRFNKDEIKEAMNPNVRYVSSIRDPRSQFESAFYYFYFRRRDRDGGDREKIECYEYPYLYVTNGRWVNFPEYISMAGKSLNESAPWFFRSRNYQSHDLGLDPFNLDEEYVLQEAKILDETLDLVIIYEHLLESLLLIKELLCLEWNDIIPPPAGNAGKYEPHLWTKEEDEILKKLTSQDQILYDYFNASLWRKVDAYGRDRMEKDVVNLKQLIGAGGSAPERKRDASQLGPAKRKDVPQRPRQDTETETANIIREMSKEFSSKEAVHDMAQRMVENYGWCPTQF